MAEVESPEEVVGKKQSKLPIIIGFVAALVGGGGGFFAVYSGMILGGESHASETDETEHRGEMPDIGFVPVEPIVVSMPGETGSQHLRFRAQLEVPSKHKSEVETLLPRVVDVLNGYLRALKTGDLEGPAALVRLRSQMLRRVQIVVGTGRVNDLLVMEFVVN